MTKILKIVPFREAANYKAQGWALMNTDDKGVTLSKDVDVCATWEEIVAMDAGTGHTKQNTADDWVA